MGGCGLGMLLGCIVPCSCLLPPAGCTVSCWLPGDKGPRERSHLPARAHEGDEVVNVRLPMHVKGGSEALRILMHRLEAALLPVVRNERVSCVPQKFAYKPQS